VKNKQIPKRIDTSNVPRKKTSDKSLAQFISGMDLNGPSQPKVSVAKLHNNNTIEEEN